MKQNDIVRQRYVSTWCEHQVLIAGAAMLYFIAALIVGGIEYLVPSFFMTMNFVFSLIYIYRFEASPFSISNLFYLVVLGFGFFFRYLYVLADPNMLTAFAPSPMKPSLEKHLLTSLTLMLFVVCFGIAFSAKKTRIAQNRFSKGIKGRVSQVDTKIFDSAIAVLVYLVVLLIVLAYKFANIRVSTELNYGTFDNLFNYLSLLPRLLAYVYLAKFLKERKNHHLVLYLAYLLPVLYLSVQAAWKGEILYEAIVLFMLLVTIKSYNWMKCGIALLVVFAVVYPTISMLRDNLIHDSGNTISASSIADYYENNSIFEYLSGRLCYYDEAYYVINVDVQTLNAFRDAAGGIVERFASGLIPRAVWPDKPVVNEGQYVTYILLGYNPLIYNNLTIGYIGDSFASYSFWGVAIFAFLLGLAFRRLESAGDPSSFDVFELASYAIIGRQMLLYAEGDIAAKTIGLLALLVITYLCAAIGCSASTIKSYGRSPSRD